jgi:hypothetical protein
MTGSNFDDDSEHPQKLRDNHCMFFCYCLLKYKNEQHFSQDWQGLRHAVHQWQNERRLDWESIDIDEVTHYLNERFFRFPTPL